MIKRFATMALVVALISFIAGYVALVANDRSNVRGVQSAILSLFSSKKTDIHLDAADVSDSTCMGCHKDIKSKKTPWHKMHLTISLTRFNCSTCHKKVTVAKRSMKGKVNVDRRICLKCHRQKFVAFLPQHKRPDWVKLHKTLPMVKKVKPLCFMCHNPKRKELDFCKQCHKKHQHSKEWIFGGHGMKARAIFDYVALKTNTGNAKVDEANIKANVANEDFVCMRCHEKKQWCTWRCHQGAPLPHNIPKWSKFWKDEPKAPKWRKVHFKVGLKIGLDKCKRCHKFDTSAGDPTLSKTPFNKEWQKKEFCQQCHHKLFYEKMPTLNVPWATKKGGMAYVKKQGSVRCWKCHDLDFCVYCHTNNVKPPYMNFTKENKSSNFKPMEQLFKEIEGYTFITKPPNFYTYYNNVTPVEHLYPEFDDRGFFKRNVPYNRPIASADK